jgi:cobalt/nickel transport system permease protein
MSHIHFPDGVIPGVWWVPGYIAALAAIFLITKLTKAEEARRKIPFAGMGGALMLIAMSVPLGFIPLHFSMAVLTGIVVGPGLGFIIVFVVNLILAFLGHGGFTVVGLNTLLMGAEVFVGVSVFRLLAARFHPVPRAVLAAAAAIFVSVALMIGLVTAAVGPEAVYHHGHHEFHWSALTGWSALFALLLVGIVLEAAVTGAVIGYILKVRPRLIESSQRIISRKEEDYEAGTD